MVQNIVNLLWKWEFAILFLIHSGRAIEVDMSGQNLITVPQTIGSNVTKLNLRGNALKILDDISFSTLVELLNLDLSSCHITFIYNGTFATQCKLEMLSLKNNNIQYLPVDFGPPTDSLLSLGTFNALADNFDLRPVYFSAFKKLKSLHTGGWVGIPFSKANIPISLIVLLAQYAFETFPDLSNLTEIKSLSLWDHDFSFIPDDYIKGMEGLHKLSIGRTNLQITPDLSDLKNLKTLWLPLNLISIIPRHTIEGLRQLRNLLLEKNEIATMPNISLLPSLRKVRLDNNRIPNVPQSTLYGLPKLLTLILSENLISHIDVSALFMPMNLFLGSDKFANLPDLPAMTLTKLHISDNRLLCNQSLCSLRMWPWFKTLPNIDNPVCAQPTDLIGISVLGVHPVRLQCYNGQ